MKAIRLMHPGKPLALEEIPVPQIGPREVLIRVKAAGICHSDVHYRAGRSRIDNLPRTLGHEVSGVVESVGSQVENFRPQTRVCVHYMATCGECAYCQQGREQFCIKGAMIGKHRDGGYAEYIAVPSRSLCVLPESVSFEHGAVMMCSSATSLHALNKARLKPGETVAIYGIGGLGLSALQLAKAFGARQIFAVDIAPGKLKLAAEFGATPIDARATDPVREIRGQTGGLGVDVALELIGLPLTMKQAVQSLAIQGRAALAGITEKSFEVAPYDELVNREAEIIGVSDHLAQEMPLLLEWARLGKLDLTRVVTRTVPLEAGAINEVLDGLEKFGEQGRSVVVP